MHWEYTIAGLLQEDGSVSTPGWVAVTFALVHAKGIPTICQGVEQAFDGLELCTS
jgi:hypothetical protein